MMWTLRINETGFASRKHIHHAFFPPYPRPFLLRRLLIDLSIRKSPPHWTPIPNILCYYIRTSKSNLNRARWSCFGITFQIWRDRLKVEEVMKVKFPGLDILMNVNIEISNSQCWAHSFSEKYHVLTYKTSLSYYTYQLCPNKAHFFLPGFCAYVSLPLPHPLNP